MGNSTNIIPAGIEGGTVNFTCSPNTTMSGGTINYGVSGKNIINYTIPAGTTSLIINNTTMGQDPAPGVQKTYTGSYNCTQNTTPATQESEGITSAGYISIISLSCYYFICLLICFMLIYALIGKK